MFRIAFILVVMLSSCGNLKVDRDYAAAYSDRECNHNHVCCQVGCACCGSPKIQRKHPREQNRARRKYRRELKRNDAE